jgi:hypothetical protein
LRANEKSLSYVVVLKRTSNLTTPAVCILIIEFNFPASRLGRAEELAFATSTGITSATLHTILIQVFMASAVLGVKNASIFMFTFILVSMAAFIFIPLVVYCVFVIEE